MQPHLLEKDRAAELTLAHKFLGQGDGWMDGCDSDTQNLATFLRGICDVKYSKETPLPEIFLTLTFF